MPQKMGRIWARNSAEDRSKRVSMWETLRYAWERASPHFCWQMGDPLEQRLGGGVRARLGKSGLGKGLWPPQWPWGESVSAEARPTNTSTTVTLSTGYTRGHPGSFEAVLGPQDQSSGLTGPRQ